MPRGAAVEHGRFRLIPRDLIDHVVGYANRPPDRIWAQEWPLHCRHIYVHTFLAAMLLELRNAQNRRPFRLSHLGLIYEWQRAASFLAAIVLTFVIALPTTRFVLALGFSLLGFGSALYGLIRRGHRPQGIAVFIDLLIAPTIIGIATLSPAITAFAGTAIAALFYFTFEIRLRVVVVGVLIGSTAHLTMSAFLGVQGPSNVILGAAVFAISVTTVGLMVMLLQWIQTRRSLARREQELESLLDATPVMLISVDHREAIASAAGQLPDPAWQPGANIADVMSEGLTSRIRAAKAGNSSAADEAIGDRWVAISCVPADGGATLIGYDITDREEALHSLEKLVETKDRFVASISHELRTPLTAVLGFAHELQQSSDPSSTERAYLDLIAEQSAEMAAIIEDLLVAVRADLGLVTIFPEPTDLSAEAAGVTASLQSRLSHPIELIGENTMGSADPIRLRQIVRNLITNADRYGSGRVEIRTATVDGRAVLEVSDDGSALTEYQQQRIFLPFESSGQGNSLPSAIGLGLAVSRTLAEKMDGTLEYLHDDGRSIFRLELPGNPVPSSEDTPPMVTENVEDDGSVAFAAGVTCDNTSYVLP